MKTTVRVVLFLSLLYQQADFYLEARATLKVLNLTVFVCVCLYTYIYIYTYICIFCKSWYAFCKLQVFVANVCISKCFAVRLHEQYP